MLRIRDSESTLALFPAQKRAPIVTLFKTEDAAKSPTPQIPLILAHIQNPHSRLRAGIALTGGAPVPTPIKLAPRAGVWERGAAG